MQDKSTFLKNNQKIVIVNDSVDSKIGKGQNEVSSFASQLQRSVVQANLGGAGTSETVKRGSKEYSEIDAAQSPIDQAVKNQLLQQQNRILEEMMAQSAGSSNMQYMPIQSMIEKLNNNLVPFNMDSQGFRTPSELFQLNQQQMRANFLSQVGGDFSELTTAMPSMKQSPPSSVIPYASTPQLAFAQFQLMAMTPENQKPLWVVRTGSKRSSVINYKTEAGHHLTKLSQGDPIKQYRLIEQFGQQKLHLLEEKLENEISRGQSGLNENSKENHKQRKQSLMKEFKLNNGDIYDVVSRAQSGKSRSTTEIRVAAKHSERSKSPPDKKQTQVNDKLKVGVNPRYLKSQRDAVINKMNKIKTAKPFDNFNLNRRFSTQETLIQQQICNQQSIFKTSNEQISKTRRNSQKNNEPTIPTAYTKGFVMEDISNFGQSGNFKSETVKTAKKVAKPADIAALEEVSVRDDLEENSSVLVPNNTCIQNAKGIGSDSKFMQYPQGDNSPQINKKNDLQTKNMKNGQNGQDHTSTRERIYTENRPHTPNSGPSFVRPDQKTNEFSIGSAENTRRNLKSNERDKDRNKSQKEIVDIIQIDGDAQTLSANKLEQSLHMAFPMAKTQQSGTFEQYVASQKRALNREDQNQRDSISIKEANNELQHLTEQFNANDREQELRNSKIVFQMTNFDNQNQVQTQTDDIGKFGFSTLSKRSTFKGGVGDTITFKKNNNDSSATVHEIMQNEKKMEQEGMLFEHRSYGLGNVVTSRIDDQSQFKTQEKLSKPYMPYMAKPAENKSKMQGGASVRQIAANEYNLAVTTPNFSYTPNRHGELEKQIDEIGATDLEQSKLNLRKHDINSPTNKSHSSVNKNLAAIQYLNDTMLNSQGLIIQRMKLQTNSARKRGLNQKTKVDNKDDQQASYKKEIEQQVSPEFARQELSDESPEKLEKTGESFQSSPNPKDVKNLQLQSPQDVTSEERSKEDKLFKMKSKIQSTLEKESFNENTKKQIQVSNFIKSPQSTKNNVITTSGNTPKKMTTDISIHEVFENQQAQDKDNGKQALVKRKNDDFEASLQFSKDQSQVIQVSDVLIQKKLKEQIDQQAKIKLEQKLKQPLHELQPKQSQQSSIGIKYQFQIPSNKRQNSMYLQQNSDNDPALNSLYSFGPQGSEIYDRQNSIIEGSQNRNFLKTGPVTSLIRNRMESFIDEQTKLGNVNVNIKNLCQQTKKARTQGNDGSLLKPIGVVDEELVYLREAVPELILARYEKSQQFYKKQIDNVSCKKGKKFIGKEIDPSVRLDKSQLELNNNMQSLIDNGRQEENRQSFQDSKIGKSRKDRDDQLLTNSTTERQNNHQRFTGDYDKGGQIGRIQLTQTRLVRSSLGITQSIHTTNQNLQNQSQFAAQQFQKRSKAGSQMKVSRGAKQEDGERAGGANHSKTGSLDSSNISGLPLNQISFTAQNRHDVPMLEPTLNDNEKSVTQVLSMNELTATQRDPNNPSAKFRVEESGNIEFDQITGAPRDKYQGQLLMACQVNKVVNQKPNISISNSAKTRDYKNLKNRNKDQMANNDLRQVNEDRSKSKSYKGAVAEHTINITLDDSTIDHQKDSNTKMNSAQKKTYDFKKGVHRDFKGLVDQNKKVKAFTGTVYSLSPTSQMIRQLQGNRILGKQKDSIQSPSNQLDPYLLGQIYQEHLPGQDLNHKMFQEIKENASNSVGASLKEDNQSTKRRDSQGSVHNSIMIKNEERQAVLSEQDAPYIRQVEGDMKHSSIQYSGKDNPLNETGNESALANRFAEPRGYSSMEDEQKLNEISDNTRKQTFDLQEKARRIKKGNTFKLEKGYCNIAHPSSNSIVTDQNTLAEYQNKHVNIDNIIPQIHSPEVKAKRPQQELAQETQTTEKATSGQKRVEANHETFGPVNERKLRELLGNRDLFSLPTTDVEDLLREARETTGDDTKNFGLIGYKAEIKPIQQLLKSQRSQDKNVAESKYGQKKQIQPFFKENRAEYTENVQIHKQFEQLQKNQQCHKMKHLNNRRQSQHTASTGIAGISQPKDNSVIDLNNPANFDADALNQENIFLKKPYQLMGQTTISKQDQINQADFNSAHLSNGSSPVSQTNQRGILPKNNSNI